MPLPPLATTSDLLDRGIEAPEGTTVDLDALLDSASAAIRDAAGTAITRATATLQLLADDSRWITIPVTPVRAVTAVTINGSAVTDWQQVDQRLHRPRGWCGHSNALALVHVTVEFGYDEAERDIVDLCCSLVAAGCAAAADGYDPKRGVSAVSIDDYRESYTRGDDEIVSPMELPQRTRDMLRRRFGLGATVVGVLR